MNRLESANVELVDICAPAVLSGTILTHSHSPYEVKILCLAMFMISVTAQQGWTIVEIVPIFLIFLHAFIGAESLLLLQSRVFTRVRLVSDRRFFLVAAMLVSELDRVLRPISVVFSIQKSFLLQSSYSMLATNDSILVVKTRRFNPAMR